MQIEDVDFEDLINNLEVHILPSGLKKYSLSSLFYYLESRESSRIAGKCRQVLSEMGYIYSMSE